MDTAERSLPRRRPARLALLAGCGLSLLAGLARGAAAPAPDPPKALTQLSLDTWHTDHGLPNATVNAVLQSRTGYIWLGTYDGLARFDGARFVTLGQRDGLGNNGVRALHEDHRGDLWVATNGGGLARLSAGRFRRWTSADGLPSDIVWSLHGDVRDGSLWIGTNGAGLARLRDGRIERFDPARSGRAIYALAQQRDGTLWLGAQDDGLRRLAPDGTWRAFGAADGLPPGLVTGLAVGPDGTLWGGTAGGGLFSIRAGRLVPLPDWMAPLRSANVTALLADEDGSLWVGTNGTGLARCAAGQVTWLSARDGLGDVIYALRRDQSGALWIGTNGAGISRLKDGSFTTWTSREGLSRDFAYTAFADRAGRLWVGTAAGLDRLEGDRFVPASPAGLRPVAVRSIAEGPDGTLWIGTYGAGVWRLREGRWQGFSQRDGLANDNVRAVLVDRAGRLWAATLAGLSVLEAGVWRSYHVADGLPSDSLIGLAEGPDGSLWFGTDGRGLVRLRDGRFQVFGTGDGLPSELVLSLRFDAEGRLWVGTNGGLAWGREGRFVSVGSGSGLPSDAVTQVAEDGQGYLWLGTSRGTVRISRSALQEHVLDPRGRELDVEAFDRADGMQSSQCTAPGQPGAVRTGDGRLWFPTTKGLASLDPRRLKRDTRPPPVVIEEVSLDGQVLPLDEGLRVPPGRHRLGFRYTTLAFLPPGRTSVRFKLEGFDSDWVDTGDRRRVDYTGVPPGDYVFRIAARTGRGPWGPGLELPVSVAPRFYQRGAFLLAAGLTLVGLVLAGHRLRVRGLEARQAELARLVDERTRGLAEQEARYRDLFEQSLGLLCTHDLEGRLLSVNPAAAEALGRAPAELIDRPLQEFLPEELRPRFARYLARMRAERAVAGTMVLLHASGERRTWRYRNVLREAPGGSAHVIGFAQDVTEEAAVQSALSESEQRFRQLAAHIDAAFFMRSVDPPELIYMSPGYERIWGRSRPANLAEFYETVHADDRAGLKAADRGQLEGQDVEYRIVRPEGSLRWIRARAFPVPDERGRPWRVAGLAEDVTPRKSVEKLRDDLAHTLVHDLRNPLTSILACLELLELDGPQATESGERVVRIARESGAKLLAMVESILDVARLEAGGVPLDRQPLDLAELVGEVLGQQRPVADLRRQSLSAELSPGLPRAWADRPLLVRVLQNLVGNAVKFGLEGGRVKVSVAPPEGPHGPLTVRVSDDGPGVPEELRPRLFEKFVTGRLPGRGAGLGLLFCRLAVEAHGGRITLENDPGPGATFAFTLPSVGTEPLPL